ncbi:GNAT family N-acetyltransferase [Halorubrum vacuolatum]|uniref:Predicted N-acyltransferase, GNAT family n=1 Tax=Halorubrum vacuolatum TaxID=63740 RepID=A0A238VMF9_HALVU|nr:GNAT family N-acetyltransferase [Halorubrum vacuolatum]SNR35535.1 Predicted N-acyltransferase, GNAT family [Halorubrum vacuolatum]
MKPGRSRESKGNRPKDDQPKEHRPEATHAPEGFLIAVATPRDRLDVLRIVDAAMLEIDVDSLDERIDAGDVFVARIESTDTVVGALTIERPGPREAAIEAVAVRRERRGRGIGSTLVARAVRTLASEPTVGRITATFDPSLMAFYTDLGFAIVNEQPGEASKDSEESHLYAEWTTGDASQ